jgi:hypothetical protein
LWNGSRTASSPHVRVGEARLLSTPGTHEEQVMDRNGRTHWRSIFAAIALVGLSWEAPPASAQGYKVIQPRINEAQAKVLSGQVATILRDAAAPNAAALKQLDDYFMGRVFPAMTDVDPVALGQLGEKRKDLFGRFINQTKSQATRDHLNANTLKAMGAIAKGQYHPAVRYNAALIIGQLDAQPGAKSLPAATELLLTFLENEQFNNVPVPTAVKVAALVSLQRHVRLGVDPPIADRITKATLAVANREELPEDVSAKAYGWVRRQAAKVLAIQSEKGVAPPVYQTFVRLVADDKSDLDDRCAVAQLLQPTMFAGAQGLNPEDMAFALGALAKEVLQVEADEAGDFIDETLKGGGFAAGGFGGGRGGYGGEGGGRYFGGEGGREGFGGFGGGMAFQPEGPTYEKRRMIDRTLAIVSGAQALAAGSSDELKQRLEEFSGLILAVAEAAAPESATLEETADAVVNLEREVNRIVSSWGPASPAAEEAAEEAEELAEPPAAEPPADAAEAPADAAGGN